MGQVTTNNTKQTNDQLRLDAVRFGNLRHYQDEVEEGNGRASHARLHCSNLQ